ncbi:MAG: bifunctional riboflavin kinase/FAD synthetase [Dehalococcoidales bacterium]|jgi:riboflavin kinase/FMN adenylyltransferase|nr:bifunctional riboflavin kinase/FAD synthetase [Dehalococcoidales bacterium]MDD4230494.1 bifunctional riboflavin kinase/FAD synthetase [Dehalococcoidales bacterium]MDD4465333.1 bifunctional riboflavin kinase/FAD synthetase [Dehalococcoidales bacterium]MDD5402361.1 bifunctional riboflavin kinase/FAD synthetase [Dehalococcoidales bacterium]
MSLEEELSNLAPAGDTLLTIGVFDGVHRGHQKLLSELVGKAGERSLSSGVITFTNHPLSQLSDHTAPPMLTSPEDKIALIKRLNADFVISLDFSPELSQTSARDFCLLLQHHLRMKGLILGFDFAMGRNREGSLGKMQALGEELGFATAVIPPVTIEGNVVSSTAIRHLIAEGKVNQAAGMLGRCYSLKGAVAAGKGIGKNLGFPTANIPINPVFATPPNGIYATFAIVDGKKLASATNIGTGPTFGGGERLVEVHILDFDRSLYGKYMEVEFIERIRDEVAFPDKDSLKAQIAEDIVNVRSVIERITRDKNG